MSTYILQLNNGGTNVFNTGLNQAALPANATQFDKTVLTATKGGIQLSNFAVDVEQTLNIGSQSSGAGAGKVTFNPLSFSKPVDEYSPKLFSFCCVGQALTATVAVFSSAGPTGQQPLILYTFKMCAVKTMSHSVGEDRPIENVTCEYGGFQITFAPTDAMGKEQATVGRGWDKIRNVADNPPNFSGA